MHTNVNWTEPINWIIILLLILLLGGQLWLLARNQTLPAGRKWLRSGLNVLLWLTIAGYFLQPRWTTQRSITHALLVGDEVPSAMARQLSDSLKISERFIGQNLNEDFDSLTLVGQRFSVQTLTRLSRSTLHWLPYSEPNSVQAMRWKGLVRQGEIQQVTGHIQASEKGLLRLMFGGQTLDSTAVQVGDNPFRLKSPAFSRGRTQWELVLGHATLDTIRFFSRPTEPLAIRFLLDSPDFESNTLAGWLGKQGHTVEVLTTLSKTINSTVNINKSGKLAPDLFITDPANAANPVIRKAVTDGKAVLFLNFTNPETDIRTINQALGSRWQVRKTSNEAAVPVGNGLNALPYRLNENLNQFAVPGYPIAVQRSPRGLSGHIGVSLLSETYPLSLRGDSIAYSQVWTAVLARLSTTHKNTVAVNAPVYSRLQQEILVNNTSGASRRLLIGPDTIALSPSPFNEHTATGSSLFRQTGWQPVQDSLSLFVYADRQTDPVANRLLVSQFIRAHAYDRQSATGITRTGTATVPNWVWLTLFISCLTMLWLEPKLA